MFKIGPDDYDRTLWEGLGLQQASLDKAAFVAISGLNRDDETPADYSAVLREAKARNLDLICANPDIVVQYGDRLIWCAGALAQDYQNLGGRVIMAGKPYAPIYELAHRELAIVAGRAIDPARILCIGDGVSTDIAGASAQSLDSLFVASGMHGETLWTNGALDPAKVEAALTAENVRATYVMSALA
jgi:HAD superfamily hydrolase (TIGR01459 family)